MKQRITGFEAYLLLFIGQSISVLGSGFTRFALGVWVYQETQSVTLFGTMSVLAVLPSILLSPFAGALVDRWDRRRTMLITDSANALSTVALAILFSTGRIELWHIALIQVYNSGLAAFQQPAYTAVTPLLVPKKLFGRISGMVTIVISLSRILEPVLGGLLVVTVGIWGVLVVDFATYLVGVFLLYLVHIPAPNTTPEGKAGQGSLKQEALYGWTYLRERAGLFALLIFATFNNFLIGVVLTLVTPLVLSFYDAAILGRILSFGGLGALASGIVLSIYGLPKRRILTILAFHLLGGIAILLAGIRPILFIFYLAAFLFFVGIPIINGAASAIWLSKVPPDLQGRVRAVQRTVSWAFLPFAYIGSGALADQVFEPLFAEGGAFANSILGTIIGTGQGYGVAFLFAIAGLLSILLPIAGYLYPRLRLLETEVPDRLADVPPAQQKTSPGEHVTDNEPPIKMSRVFRLVMTTLAAVLAAVVVVVVFAFVLVIRRPFPQTNGTLAFNPIQAPTHIYRDEYGIPHIEAQNTEDLFFAQGYVHAQDRFWQMELLRLVSQGTLSEVFGSVTLEPDRLARNVGWHRAAVADWAWYQENDPETVRVLEAYSAGINAYLDDHRENFSLNMTIWQVVATPWEIKPWTPTDSLAIGVFLDWSLGGGLYREQERAILAQRLGETAVSELWPYYSADRPYIMADQEWATTTQTQLPLPHIDNNLLTAPLIGSAPDAWGFNQRLSPFAGSNSWVISGELSDTGLPLLANDPHLSLEMPSRWYEIGLRAPGWNVIGFSMAGIPGVLIGRNDHIAWGLTNARIDTQDIFIEKLNPENPLQYEFEGKWRDVEVIEEVIKVWGQEDIILPVRFTHHGPILNEPDERLTEVLSLSWTTLHGPSRVFKALLLLNQAQTYDDFQTAMQFWDSLAQNVVYADVEGNIAYQLPGRIPIRPNSTGSLPVPGWTGEYEWQGWIPFEEMPHLFNPESGFIVTANNAIVSQNYPYVLSQEWGAGDRAARIEQMIQETLTENGRITMSDFARIQLDTKSLMATDYVPLLLDLSSNDQRVNQALQHLQNWDFQEQKDSIATSIFEIFYMHLAHETLADELGDIPDVYLFDGNTQLMFFHHLAQQPNAIWWDNINTATPETREQILLQALVAALDWLENRLGADMNQWQWSSLHTITFISTPVGEFGLPLIDDAVNRGPFPVDGGNSVISATDWAWEEPAISSGGVTFRFLTDLSALDTGQGVHATGQSGHPFHRHYDDLIPLWLNGEYHPLFLSPDAVAQNAVDHLLLTNK